MFLTSMLIITTSSILINYWFYLGLDSFFIMKSVSAVFCLGLIGIGPRLGMPKQIPTEVIGPAY